MSQAEARGEGESARDEQYENALASIISGALVDCGDAVVPSWEACLYVARRVLSVAPPGAQPPDARPELPDCTCRTDAEIGLCEKSCVRDVRAAPQPPADKSEGPWWVVIDDHREPIHIASWPEACHEHINDAINEHKIEEASKWAVREAIPREIHERLVAEKDAEIERLKAIVSRYAAALDQADRRAEAAEIAVRGAKREALREAADRISGYDTNIRHQEVIESLRFMASEHERGGKT